MPADDLFENTDEGIRTLLGPVELEEPVGILKDFLGPGGGLRVAPAGEQDVLAAFHNPAEGHVAIQEGMREAMAFAQLIRGKTAADGFGDSGGHHASSVGLEHEAGTDPGVDGLAGLFDILRICGAAEHG